MLHFSWSFSSDVLSLYFLLMWNLVMRNWFFPAKTKLPALLLFLYSLRRELPFASPCPFKYNPAPITAAPMDAQRVTVLL